MDSADQPSPGSRCRKNALGGFFYIWDRTQRGDLSEGDFRSFERLIHSSGTLLKNRRVERAGGCKAKHIGFHPGFVVVRRYAVAGQGLNRSCSELRQHSESLILALVRRSSDAVRLFSRWKTLIFPGVSPSSPEPGAASGGRPPEACAARTRRLRRGERPQP